MSSITIEFVDLDFMKFWIMASENHNN